MLWLSYLFIIPRDAQKESGQGLAEYAIILALLAIVVVAALSLYGNSVENLYNYAVTELLNAFSGNATP